MLMNEDEQGQLTECNLLL